MSIIVFVILKKEPSQPSLLHVCKIWGVNKTNDKKTDVTTAVALLLSLGNLVSNRMGYFQGKTKSDAPGRGGGDILCVKPVPVHDGRRQHKRVYFVIKLKNETFLIAFGH